MPRSRGKQYGGPMATAAVNPILGGPSMLWVHFRSFMIHFCAEAICDKAYGISNLNCELSNLRLNRGGHFDFWIWTASHVIQNKL
jgi:hypothetical protein